MISETNTCGFSASKEKLRLTSRVILDLEQIQRTMQHPLISGDQDAESINRSLGECEVLLRRLHFQECLYLGLVKVSDIPDD